MNGFAKIIDIASRVSTPLAVTGITLAILFFIFRQILAKNIFPRLTRSHGGALLKQVVDRLFVLALVAMVLGFAGYLLPLKEPDPQVRIEPSPKEAESILAKLYNSDFASLYDQMPPAAREQVPFGVFAANTRITMSQFKAPPRDRYFKNKQVVAGQMFLSFDAQFDDVSRFRETLTYLDTDRVWTLWRFEIVPADWPPLGMMKALGPGSAGELRNQLAQIADRQKRTEFTMSDVVDHWVRLPGWTGRVESVLSRKGSRTCDVAVIEETSRVRIVVRGMLDGCDLRAEQRLTIVGRVESVTDDQVEISASRYSRDGA